MRIITMLFILLVFAGAGIGAWVMLAPESSSVLPGKNAEQEKIKRKQAKWREAPYVILAPAETLPEKQSAVSPPPEPAKPKAAATPVSPSPAPRPAPVAAKTPPKEAAPAALSAPTITSSIAKQALETVIGPQAAPETRTVPQPKTMPAPKPLTQSAPPIIAPPQITRVVTPPAPAPAPREAAKEKKKLQLPYETKTKNQNEALKQQQAMLAKEQIRFKQPVPISSGALKSGNMTIVLAGLDALGASEQCKYETGRSWECGRWGKYALRRLIRGRSIVCKVLDQVTETTVTARCNVASVDINTWVVRRGWGLPTGEESEKFNIALKAARNDKLGQWSVESAEKQN